MAFANDRLGSLGAGRYLLEHTDTRSGQAAPGSACGSSTSGPGRRVRPLEPPEGRRSMASLALALGLADAVRSNSAAATRHLVRR